MEELAIKMIQNLSDKSVPIGDKLNMIRWIEDFLCEKRKRLESEIEERMDKKQFKMFQEPDQ